MSLGLYVAYADRFIPLLHNVAMPSCQESHVDNGLACVEILFHLIIFCIDHRLGVWLEGRTETGIQLDDLEPEASLKPL